MTKAISGLLIHGAFPFLPAQNDFILTFPSIEVLFDPVALSMFELGKVAFSATLGQKM